MKLKIGDKVFRVKTVSTPEDRKKGLAGLKEGAMPNDAGLLLKFDTEANIPITMDGMNFPIDIIFILDGKVRGLKKGKVGATKDISIAKTSDSVLELNAGAAEGLNLGATVEMVGTKGDDGTIEVASEGGKLPEEGDMHVLDENGAVQMNIEGDERVYSRTHTKQLVKLAQQAALSELDTDYKKVGRAMIRIVTKQDTQKKQYSKN